MLFIPVFPDVLVVAVNTYGTSRKVDFLALYARFKRTKNEKEFGIQAEFFFAYKMFTNMDMMLTFDDERAIIEKIP